MIPMPKVGVVIPNRWVDRVPDPEELVTFFQRVESLGFHSLWVTDRPLHQRVSMPSPLIMLTYAAAHTQRVRLGTAVFLLTLRHPVDVARQAVTIDLLSRGRLTLGVSMGARENEYRALNAPKGQRVGRLEESIAVLRKLWTEADVTYHGRYYHLEQANVLPRPVQASGIPLVLGASSEAGLRRAGRLGDGWVMGTPGGTEAFARGWQTVQEAAQEAGRDPTALTNGKLLLVNVDQDEALAEEELHAHLQAYYGGNVPPNEAIAAGSPEVIKRAVQDYGEVGCQTVLLFLPWLDLAKLERLAEAVLARPAA